MVTTVCRASTKFSAIHLSLTKCTIESVIDVPHVLSDDRSLNALLCIPQLSSGGSYYISVFASSFLQTASCPPCPLDARGCQVVEYLTQSHDPPLLLAWPR